MILDGDIVKAARANAELRWCGRSDPFPAETGYRALSHPKKYGFLITNPPYGERIEEKENLPALYTEIGDRFRALDELVGVISSLPMRMRRSTWDERQTKTVRSTTV